MYIIDYMTSDPITISTDMLLPDARRLLNEYRIRHLPVTDYEQRLVGIITDRDLRSAYPSSVISRSEKVLTFEQVEKTTVVDIMTTSCSTLGPDATLDDALRIFDTDKVGAIPVVSSSALVLGMFSLLDLNTAYRKIFGVGEEGSFIIGVDDDERENILSELVVLLDSNNIPLTRLFRLVGKNDERKIFMRINSPNPVQVFKLLKAQRFVLLSVESNKE